MEKNVKENGKCKWEMKVPKWTQFGQLFSVCVIQLILFNHVDPILNISF